MKGQRHLCLYNEVPPLEGLNNYFDYNKNISCIRVWLIERHPFSNWSILSGNVHFKRSISQTDCQKAQGVVLILKHKACIIKTV